jgi:hypothetical protein
MRSAKTSSPAWQRGVFTVLMVAVFFAPGHGQQSAAAAGSRSDVDRLVAAVRTEAKALENSGGMRQGFADFTAAYKLKQDSVSYSNYVTVRLLYEATRDAGFWNVHWTITNREPNSDNVWRQWKAQTAPSFVSPTASAECDELSALYAFLAGRAGVHGVGLLWPYPNHTVAAWVLHLAKEKEVRVVVPTSQIFLDATDSFGTRKFDAWKQKTIFEYKRRDVPDSFELPAPLFEMFVTQLHKYGGASDATLQQLRYLREGVFLHSWTAETAARDALRRRDRLASALPEDLAAFQHFAEDMRAGVVRP